MRTAHHPHHTSRGARAAAAPHEACAAVVLTALIPAVMATLLFGAVWMRLT